LTVSEDITSSKENTEVVYNMDIAVLYGVRFLQNVQEKIDLLVDDTGPSLIMKFDIYKGNYIKARKRGAKIRCITEITPDNIQYCKELMKIVDELRHLEGLKGSIVVSESEFISTTTWREKQLLNPIIYSKEKELVEQYQYIFDIIWKKAIPYTQRIKEIEEGIVPEVIETISNYIDILSKTFGLLNSANNEILVIFSTSNAFHRQVHAGALQKLIELIDNKPWVTIRILTPKDNEIEKIIAELNNSNITVRFIEPLSSVSILIMDKKYSLVAETKDDTKQILTEATGFVTYSNSAPTVLSYAAIFESLWKQTELYEQLQIHERMQKEFINTAAHELRTLIQPILGITELIKNELKDDKHNELLVVISRNAQRLKKLSEDILDITRIESNLLNLDKEHFRIMEVILDIVNSYKINTDTKKIKFEYISTTTAANNNVDDNDLTVYADKNSIIRVISNLISNSIKFIPQDGIVSISSERKRITSEYNEDCKEVVDDSNAGNDDAIVVSVRDTGIGIDTELFTKLFTKFTTKSFQGMGLGLYISKNTIEAHGGSIWAENNKDGNKGSTFSFSLPWNDKK